MNTTKKRELGEALILLKTEYDMATRRQAEICKYVSEIQNRFNEISSKTNWVITIVFKDRFILFNLRKKSKVKRRMNVEVLYSWDFESKDDGDLELEFIRHGPDTYLNEAKKILLSVLNRKDFIALPIL